VKTNHKSAEHVKH